MITQIQNKGVLQYGCTLANYLIPSTFVLSNDRRKQKGARHPLFKGMEMAVVLPRVMASSRSPTQSCSLGFILLLRCMVNLQEQMPFAVPVAVFTFLSHFWWDTQTVFKNVKPRSICCCAQVYGITNKGSHFLSQRWEKWNSGTVSDENQIVLIYLLCGFTYLLKEQILV